MLSTLQYDVNEFEVPSENDDVLVNDVNMNNYNF